MKILFVQPNSTNNIINSAMHIYNFEPLGLYYLAATVVDYHDVCMVDLNNELILAEQNYLDHFSEIVKSFQPHIVAFSALTSVRTGKIMQLSKTVKKINKQIVTLVGGVHCSLWPSDFEDGYIDIIISRDNIQTFSNVIRLIEQKYGIEDIKKIISINNSQIHALNLNKWLVPYRKMGDKYKGFYRIVIGKPGYSKISHPVASVKTSSGCPFRCRFCCLWELYPKHEIRKVDSVVLEIASIKEDYVFFADDESLINTNYILRIADALVKSGLKKKYIMYGRADSIVNKPILIEKLAKAGLKQIWIGIEGSTDEQLEKYKKKNAIISHAQAFDICQKNGVDIHATALVDHHFKKDDFDYMLKYTKDMLGLTSCHFFVLTPFKGTAFYKELKKSTPEKFLTDNSDHFSIRQSVLRPDYMPIEEFHQRYADLQKNFNSDTIPFSIEASNVCKVHSAEFESLRRSNEQLYANILNAHRFYETRSVEITNKGSYQINGKVLRGV